MKLNIFGAIMAVRKRKSLGNDEGCVGIYYPGKNLIEIEASLKGTELDQVLIHEAIHATLDRLNISSSLPDDTEEIICDSIATMIVENFRITKKR